AQPQPPSQLMAPSRRGACPPGAAGPEGCPGKWIGLAPSANSRNSRTALTGRRKGAVFAAALSARIDRAPRTGGGIGCGQHRCGESGRKKSDRKKSDRDKSGYAHDCLLGSVAFPTPSINPPWAPKLP